jgi:hypothetical protein
MNDNFFMGTIGASGTAGTFLLNDVNPVLGFMCGVLTIIHLGICIYKKSKDGKDK